jgi:Tol biopolymer transport system component
MDVATGRASKLTDDPAWEFDPAWSPDGTQVAFNSNRPRPGPYRLFVRASNGSGKDVPLVERDSGVNADSPIGRARTSSSTRAATACGHCG